MQSGLTWVGGGSTPRNVYLTRMWNFGTWEEWRQKLQDYPRTAVEEVVQHPLRGQWTRHGKAFAEAFCGLAMPDDVLISYDP